MNRHLPSIVLFVLLAGCNRASDSSASRELPARITNEFGMTFCLVRVDEARPDHDDSFPSSSFYLQKTEMDRKQFDAFRNAVDLPDRLFKRWYPYEWIHFFNLSGQLSKHDSQYDYRLPTQSEWTFACMNGYDQDCPGPGARPGIDDSPAPTRPNKYGIKEFMDYDAECASEPGLFLGKGQSGNPNVKCKCTASVRGNPKADDGLNELITARFVLMLPGDSKLR